MEPKKNYQMTHPAPIVWNYLVTPKPERTDNKGRVFRAAYETTILLTPEHPDWQPLRGLMRAALPAGAAEKFPVDLGDTIADEAKAKNKDREWARGKIMLGVKSAVKKQDGSLLMPPRLFVLLNGKYESFGVTNERILATPYFYSGVQAIGTFTINGYEGMGGGVNLYLNEVLSLNVGERIAGGADPDEKYGDPSRFAHVTGHVSAVDPTKGLAGLV